MQYMWFPTSVTGFWTFFENHQILKIRKIINVTKLVWIKNIWLRKVYTTSQCNYRKYRNIYCREKLIFRFLERTMRCPFQRKKKKQQLSDLLHRQTIYLQGLFWDLETHDSPTEPCLENMLGDWQFPTWSCQGNGHDVFSMGVGVIVKENDSFCQYSRSFDLDCLLQLDEGVVISIFSYCVLTPSLWIDRIKQIVNENNTLSVPEDRSDNFTIRWYFFEAGSSTVFQIFNFFLLMVSKNGPNFRLQWQFYPDTDLPRCGITLKIQVLYPFSELDVLRWAGVVPILCLPYTFQVYFVKCYGSMIDQPLSRYTHRHIYRKLDVQLPIQPVLKIVPEHSIICAWQIR